MRQVMPHRNNIELRRTKSKRYFSGRWKNPGFRPDDVALERPRIGGASAKTAVRTGIYMMFSGSSGGRASTEKYMRYADFAGARA